MNYLSEIGFLNGAIGTVIEILYRDSIVVPTNKQHYHTPNYVVVDIPHLDIPAHIRLWDKDNPAVSFSTGCKRPRFSICSMNSFSYA